MTVENWTLPTRKWNRLHPPDPGDRALNTNICAFADQVIIFAFSCHGVSSSQDANNSSDFQFDGGVQGQPSALSHESRPYLWTGK
jgi:hypothetical protein